MKYLDFIEFFKFETHLCLIDMTVNINQLTARWKRLVINVLNAMKYNIVEFSWSSSIRSAWRESERRINILTRSLLMYNQSIFSFFPHVHSSYETINSHHFHFFSFQVHNIFYHRTE